jgi:anti-sigma factor (TIGR02949 family)
MNCRDCDALLTPLADGELAPDACAAIEAHLAACPSCRSAFEAETAGRALLRSCADRLTVNAPAALRARVRRALPAERAAARRRWLLAGAATGVAAVALVAIAGVVRPVPLFAAQAALDHLKCARLGPQAASSDPHTIEASWKAWQGWDLHVPTGTAAGMRLLGYRRCLLTEGRVAHLLYEQGGRTVSLIVLPDGPETAESELEMFGQDAVLWTSHGLTYALVGPGGRGALTNAAHLLQQEAARSGSGS